MVESKMKDYLRNEMCGQIAILQESDTRYRLGLPFFLSDGDGFSIVLTKEPSGSWVLTDEASTLMHLSVHMPDRAFEKGSRARILGGLKERYGVQNRDGELYKKVGSAEKVGAAVFEFAQALLRLTDTDMLSREYTHSTFQDEFKTFVAHTLPHCYITDWHSDNLDPKGIYKVDAWVNTKESPIFLFALNTDGRIKDATIAIQHYDMAGYDNTSVGVFDGIEDKNGKAVSRLRDVADGIYESFGQRRGDLESMLLSRADPLDE